MFDQAVLDSINVTAHSCVRIAGEKIIYIDPIRIEGEPHDADIILFTHAHFDHFSPKDVKKLIKQGTVIGAPEKMAGKCRKAFGIEPVSFVPAMTYELCGVTVETVAAYNMRKRYHPKKMGWCGYILTICETRVYIAGDTDSTQESESVCCDIAVLPIGGMYTVDPTQAAELANKIKPHTVIPYHYGKMLGGKDAPIKFKAALDRDIESSVRLSAYTDIMMWCYIRIGSLMAVGAVLGLLIKMV